MLRIHKHADRSQGRSPDGTYPLAGVTLEVDDDGTARLTPRTVLDGIFEGWITATGEKSVSRPGGPVQNPCDPRYLHNFVHYDTLTFHTLDGDVTFKVTHQPDKYADYAEASNPDAIESFEADDKTKVTDEMYAAGATRVDHFYELKAAKR